MLVADVITHLYTLHFPMGFADFPTRHSLKCGTSNKGSPGLEDHCYCVYQCIIFLAVFYYRIIE